MSSKTSENMQWHFKKRVSDGNLRHLADSQAWKEFDERHYEFLSRIYSPSEFGLDLQLTLLLSPLFNNEEPLSSNSELQVGPMSTVKWDPVTDGFAYKYAYQGVFFSHKPIHRNPRFFSPGDFCSPGDSCSPEAILWAILVLRSILILRALTFDVSSVDQRKASSAEFHHRKAYCSEFDVSSVHHQKASSSEFHHWKVSSAEFHASSAEFEHRKPSSAEFDYRKPSFAEFDDKKPSSPDSITGKPVIVRVKRKASQAKLDSFWLEINERPRKKAFLGLGNLSISDCGTGKVLNELASKKMLVQRLETVGHSQSVKDVLHSFLDLARSARFEQIWKKRGSIDAEECSLHEKCHLYDVVRVDAEDETHQRVPNPKFLNATELLLRLVVQVWISIYHFYENSFHKQLKRLNMTKQLRKKSNLHTMINFICNNFVYDIYTMGVGVDTDTDNIDEYPFVQVYVEDDYYDGPLQSGYESDDSNAENNPWNDYRDEESDFEDSNSDYDQSEEEDREDSIWGYR
ncbi:hypothetical protein ZIOFF_022672 [Zingiber officinale]|uniref:RNA polymerase II nuclear localization protein SLC7A6OS n=1 Tax=Zingiber officinale TaxID=94328 RepID=A0A8J5LKA9_ZINOF|nr:hypothetical protein ZIOFF_022672 [Zingiber officinale]